MLKRSNNVKDQIDDANLQFIVLLQLVIERIEFLEENKYVFGNIKQFLKNSKAKYENFIRQVFKNQETIEGDSAKEASSKLFVMQERVEKALLNEYIITVDERRKRAREILNEFVTAPYHPGDDPLKVEVRQEVLIDTIIAAMAEKNLFNF